MTQNERVMEGMVDEIEKWGYEDHDSRFVATQYGGGSSCRAVDNVSIHEMADDNDAFGLWEDEPPLYSWSPQYKADVIAIISGGWRCAENSSPPPTEEHGEQGRG